MERDDRRPAQSNHYVDRGSVRYLVFARKEYQQPLECLGEAAIESESAAQDELMRITRERFGEGWIEMVAVPESAVVRIIPME